FLYHWEAASGAPAVESGLVRLDQNQIASRLSYLIWASMPDPELFAAADANRLGTPEEIAQQVRRMIRHRYFAPVAADFHRQWMGVVSLASAVRSGNAVYDDFTRNQAAYAKSMDAELDAFTGYVLQGAGDGHLRTLLTAPYSFVDSWLAKIYGL